MVQASCVLYLDDPRWKLRRVKLPSGGMKETILSAFVRGARRQCSKMQRVGVSMYTTDIRMYAHSDTHTHIHTHVHVMCTIHSGNTTHVLTHGCMHIRTYSMHIHMSHRHIRTYAMLQ